MSEVLEKKISNLETKIDDYMVQSIELQKQQVSILHEISAQGVRNDNQDKILEEHQEQIKSITSAISEVKTSQALEAQATESNKELVKELKGIIVTAIKWLLSIFGSLITLGIIGGLLFRFSS